MPHLDGHGVHGARACYQGLLRPRLDSPRDEDIYIYVTRAAGSFTLRRDANRKVWTMDAVPAPLDSVFVAFVELPDDIDDPRVVEWREQSGNPDVRGLIHDWEWTRAGTKDPTLPAPDRFKHQLWTS
jgi:hypothetical protein